MLSCAKNAVFEKFCRIVPGTDKSFVFSFFLSPDYSYFTTSEPLKTRRLWKQKKEKSCPWAIG